MTWIGPAGADEVEVPDLIGLIVSVARILARDSGLALAAADPDGPPLAALTSPGLWVVVSQRPPPGATLRRNGTVVVDCQQWPPSDEMGDREPRRPLPYLDVLGGEPSWTDDTDLRARSDRGERERRVWYRCDHQTGAAGGLATDLVVLRRDRERG